MSDASTCLQLLLLVVQDRDGDWLWVKLQQVLLILLELGLKHQAGLPVPAVKDLHFALGKCFLRADSIGTEPAVKTVTRRNNKFKFLIMFLCYFKQDASSRT